MTLMIGVIGSAPGIGKSTLCHALVKWLQDQGSSVDHFREEEILERAEFVGLATEFHTAKRVELGTIIDSMRKFASSVREYDVVVLDSLLPFTPSLLVWGYSEAEIATFLDELASVLAEHRTVIVYLKGDPDRALQRAAEREGPGWLEGYFEKMRSCGVTDAESAGAHLRRENDLTRRTLEAQPWRVITVDTDGATPQDVAMEVQNLLGMGP